MVLGGIVRDRWWQGDRQSIPSVSRFRFAGAAYALTRTPGKTSAPKRAVCDRFEFVGAYCGATTRRQSAAGAGGPGLLGEQLRDRLHRQEQAGALRVRIECFKPELLVEAPRGIIQGIDHDRVGRQVLVDRVGML